MSKSLLFHCQLLALHIVLHIALRVNKGGIRPPLESLSRPPWSFDSMGFVIRVQDYPR